MSKQEFINVFLSDLDSVSKIKAKSKIFEGYWSENDCDNSPRTLFIFGDNDIKTGRGGQAVIRFCKNSFGIPTKKYPNYRISSYYMDSDYDNNIIKIKYAIENLIKKSEDYDVIMFPKNGLGTGLSKMQIYAPKTLTSMNEIIKNCFGIDYTDIK